MVWVDELEGLRPAPVGRASGFLPFGKSAPSLTSVVPRSCFRCLVCRRAERKQRAHVHERFHGAGVAGAEFYAGARICTTIVENQLAVFVVYVKIEIAGKLVAPN